MNIAGKIQGSGGLRIFTEKQGKEHMLARVKSNMDEFTGRIEIGSPSETSSKAYRSPVVFGESVAGGDIAVNPCGVIGPYSQEDKKDYFGELSVKNLVLSDGSMVRLGYNGTAGGTIRVTESLRLPESGKVGIDITELPRSCLAGRRHPILIAPPETRMDAGSFELKVVAKVEGLSDDGAQLSGKIVACSLEVDDSSDCKILYLVVDKYTCLKISESWGASGWTAEHSTNWYDIAVNTPISPDMVYIDYHRQMTMPTTSGSVFGGKKLVISYPNFGALIAAKETTVPDLVMTYGGRLRFWNMDNAKLYGKITLMHPDANGYSMCIANAREYSANIYSDIAGSGGIKVLGSNERTNARTDNTTATVSFSGDNSAFSGRIYVTNVKNDPATNMTLRISDVKQLGGAMEKFTYNGLGFANWSRFQADASLNLSEPTRGVYFLGGNYVNVPNAAHTLTLASQTTMAGKLVKEGAGTLALGGTVKFTSSQKDVPEAGTNVLHVANGRIMPVSKGGADGLAISFAEGTGLRLSPLGEGDSDVKGYGLYNVKWSAPFNLEETDGKLNVALDMPSNRSEIPGKFSFGVCTVSEAAAESLRDNIELPTVRGYALTVSEECIDEGTVTFKASYCRRGLSVIVK